MKAAHFHPLSKDRKPVIARNAMELAEVLGLDFWDGVQIGVRSALNTKIINVARGKGLTHAQIAARAGTSRTRVTAIMNRNTRGISTDLMLRVLASLGVVASVSFSDVA